jgi:hypothetical protein
MQVNAIAPASEVIDLKGKLCVPNWRGNLRIQTTGIGGTEPHAAVAAPERVCWRAALVRPMAEDLCAAVVQHIEGVHVQIWQAARQNRC